MGAAALALTLIGTALGAHALMPLARRLARHHGLVDHPSWRRSQTEAVPCSGGLAVYLATLAGALVLLVVAGSPFEGRSLLALGLAGLATLVLGVADDRFGLHAEKKLLGQILVVSLPMASGLSLTQLALPGLGVVELGLLSGPFTLFWYLGFINSMNLIDGLDGLAAGIATIALGALAATLVGVDPVALAWVLLPLGAVVGFLRNNLSRDRIFLGDAGSMLLGLWLAGLAIGVSGSAPAAPGVAALAMLVPVADTATTILRRRRRRVSVFCADAEHLHHRLVRLGCPPRRAVAALCFLSLAGASLGNMAYGLAGAGIIALGAAAAAAIEFAYTLPRGGHPTAREAVAYLLGHGRLPGLEPDEVGQLAEVIEMSVWRESRRPQPKVTPAPAPPAPAAQGPAPAPRPATVAEEEDVVLALGEELP